MLSLLNVLKMNFKQGYKTIICNSEHDPNKEKDYLEMLAANQCDGIISSSHNLGIEDYEKVEAPIVATVISPQRFLSFHLTTEGGQVSRKSSGQGWLSTNCHDYRL